MEEILGPLVAIVVLFLAGHFVYGKPNHAPDVIDVHRAIMGRIQLLNGSDELRKHLHEIRYPGDVRRLWFKTDSLPGFTNKVLTCEDYRHDLKHGWVIVGTYRVFFIGRRLTIEYSGSGTPDHKDIVHGFVTSAMSMAGIRGVHVELNYPVL